MKEIFRNYGGGMIAALTGVILLGLIAGLPYASVQGEKVSKEYTVESRAFEDYWRNH